MMDIPQGPSESQCSDSTIHFTNIMIKSASNTQHDLPHHALLSVEVIGVNGDTIDSTMPVLRSCAMSSWMLNEAVKVPANITSFTLFVVREHAGQIRERLGFTELNTAECVARFTGEFSRPLIKTSSDNPSLELITSFSVILVDSPGRLQFSHNNTRTDISDYDTSFNTSAHGSSNLWFSVLPHVLPARRAGVQNRIVDMEYTEVLLLADEHPEKPSLLMGLGALFAESYLLLNNNVDLDKAISAYENAVRLTPRSHVDRPSRLRNLGTAHLYRAERLGDPIDIDNSISALSEAVDIISISHPDRLACLNNLSSSFSWRFERSGNLTDLDKSISAISDAIDLAPDDHPEKPDFLNNIGISFNLRFQHLGKLEDLHKSISALEEAIHLTPAGNQEMSSLLITLGSLIISRFERLGSLDDLNKSISTLTDAMNLSINSCPDEPDGLSNLGVALRWRFERLENIEDINKSISALEGAISHTRDNHPHMPSRLNNIGISFMRRFERSSDIADLRESISAHTDAVRLTPDGHVQKPARLNNTSISFMCRYNRFGDVADIDQSISALENALRLSPDSHPDKPAYLNSLGVSLSRRLERLGHLTDIDKSISALDDAVHLTPDDHQIKPTRLNNLATSYARRFERLGDPLDLDKSILALENALRLTSNDHPDIRARLNNLGITLMWRFELLGNVADIDKAISVHEDAVRLTPDRHPDKSIGLNNLGNSLLLRRQNLSEIDWSISVLTQAVDLTPDNHPYRHARLSNLGASFVRRFECLRDLADIDKSFSALYGAVNLTPDGHPDKPSHLNRLGNLYIIRFECSKNRDDFDNAINLFRRASQSSTGSPSERFRAALRWARLVSAEAPTLALDAYTVALALLPRIAWFGRTIAERYKELVTIGNVAIEAAAIAISAEMHETALEWLEQGRSIVWGQLLHLRSPVDELRAVDPDLADRLAQVSVELENASHREVSTEELTMEQIAQRHRRLATEWEGLAEKARTIPKFKDFLRPKKLSQLRSAAQTGPVVVLHIHRERCDALVLLHNIDDILHIPLKYFSYGQGRNLQRSLHKLLSTAGVRMRDTRATQVVSINPSDRGFDGILSDLWTFVVKPVLDGLAFQISNSLDPPRLWWCATGPLTFLPIHAAGLYSKSDAGFKVSDFVVSSYTPTLTALLHPSLTTQREFLGLLTVSQASTPGQSPLPNAEKEMIHIKQHTSSLRTQSLREEVATVKSVLEGMAQCSWVHFACHAVQHTSKPTESAICLHDGKLTLSKITTKSFPHADFAFLSACQTATGDDNLSEEAVHLAAGMLAGGYRSVIATMWSIKDDDAPLIADKVYPLLVNGSQTDSTRAAYALHHAVQHLREKLDNSGKSSFLSWVPFIHVGM